MVALTLNAGSSSLKFALFDGEREILRGEVEGVDGTPCASIGTSFLQPIGQACSACPD